MVILGIFGIIFTYFFFKLLLKAEFLVWKKIIHRSVSRLSPEDWLAWEMGTAIVLFLFLLSLFFLKDIPTTEYAGYSLDWCARVLGWPVFSAEEIRMINDWTVPCMAVLAYYGLLSGMHFVNYEGWDGIIHRRIPKFAMFLHRNCDAEGTWEKATTLKRKFAYILVFLMARTPIAWLSFGLAALVGTLFWKDASGFCLPLAVFFLSMAAGQMAFYPLRKRILAKGNAEFTKLVNDRIEFKRQARRQEEEREAAWKRGEEYRDPFEQELIAAGRADLAQYVRMNQPKKKILTDEEKRLRDIRENDEEHEWRVENATRIRKKNLKMPYRIFAAILAVLVIAICFAVQM